MLLVSEQQLRTIPRKDWLEFGRDLKTDMRIQKWLKLHLKAKPAAFPKLTYKDNNKLYDLSDIVSELESIKEDEQYLTLMSYYDSSSGVIPIVNKLPHALQEKWTTQAVKYQKNNNNKTTKSRCLSTVLLQIGKG